MASQGQVMENPATKERIVFRARRRRPAARWGCTCASSCAQHCEPRSWLEAFVGFVRAGKVNVKGNPHPLELTLIAREFEAEGYATKPPLAVQRALLAPAAALARLLGRRIS